MKCAWELHAPPNVLLSADNHLHATWVALRNNHEEKYKIMIIIYYVHLIM